MIEKSFAIRRVLILGYVWPEPKSSAAGTRMLELVQLFLQMQCDVTFASAAVLSEHRFDLKTLGVAEVSIELNSSSFDGFVKGLQPDLVLFDRFFTEEQFGWRVAKTCPLALRILDTEDLHSLRYTRQQLLKASQQGYSSEQEKQSVGPVRPEPAALYQHMCAQDVTLREVAAIFRCDLSLMISQYEIDLLQNYFSVDSRLLFHTPFLTSDYGKQQGSQEFSKRKHFIAIGNFRHEPNWDSVLWLKHQLWPLIRAQLPDAQLHIYGAYPPPKATQLQKVAEGFHIKGWAEEANTVMQQARVCLAPLRFGAGIKGKLMDAMRNGTPSVTTSIGAESMVGKGPWGGAIADDAAAFVNAAVCLYQDEERWRAAQEDGFSTLESYFSSTDYAARLREKLCALAEGLAQHRRDNFIGQMLQHHSMKSTQYMGQWIEAKNKNKTNCE